MSGGRGQVCRKGGWVGLLPRDLPFRLDSTDGRLLFGDRTGDEESLVLWDTSAPLPSGLRSDGSSPLFTMCSLRFLGIGSDLSPHPHRRGSTYEFGTRPRGLRLRTLHVPVTPQDLLVDPPSLVSLPLAVSGKVSPTTPHHR